MKFLKLKFNNFEQGRGFTLIETLVAVSIFTVSILALMAVLSDSVATNAYAKKKIVATYLGQEGLELVRNLRDTSVLYQSTLTRGWDDFKQSISPCDSTLVDACYIDDTNIDFLNTAQAVRDLNISSCSEGDCPALLYNDITGKYGYKDGNETDFIRNISVTNVTENEVKVTSKVYWQQGSGTYFVSFSENLFDWTRQ